MNPLYKLAGAAVLLLVVLCALMPGGGGQPAAGPELTLYCAAALRSPIERLAHEYERDRGVRLQVQWGGSNTLLSQIEIAGQGDLYLAADGSFVQLARAKGLVDDSWPVARMSAVVVVARGNPLGVGTLDDLLSCRVAIGGPDQTAIGAVVRDRLAGAGRWAELRQRVRAAGVMTATVAEAANSVKLGAADAGVVWDAVAGQYPELEALHLPEFAGADADVVIGVLAGGEHRPLAAEFCEYLSAPARGGRAFAEAGYAPVSTPPATNRGAQP